MLHVPTFVENDLKEVIRSIIVRIHQQTVAGGFELKTYGRIAARVPLWVLGITASYTIHIYRINVL